eukprot:CAMPEP_0175063788 /NCGR_PEP_ID=MMETSP0052_2-20121109/14959_1 /TAXON_ID=51329 ORGANISM="Polytomella parva, Strain SAG 63-3" /NCGR_SAMPLE_ID=MMETSP0052_2 /ASSEMBLY_ACC=CAM_ASM_000194 /LENGTH=230 /DNA_ID=CAMNT_0016330041 /DNA_START=239 /DNA_END=932 /DNA_ORIENTATION=-
MDYRDYIREQASEVSNLHTQVEQLQAALASTSDEAEKKCQQMKEENDRLEMRLRTAHEQILDMEARTAASETALLEAETMANAAAVECKQLQEAVSVLAEHDAATRKLLATRAHVLKSALLIPVRSKMRQGTEERRRQKVETEALLRLRQQEADRGREKERAALKSQLAAQALVERAAARLEVEQLKMELDAYKEPWQYMYGNLSPTKDTEVAKKLGLNAGSLNVMTQRG